MSFGRKVCECKRVRKVDEEPDLAAILPPHYKYALCYLERKNNEQFVCRFRINISDKKKAKKWLQDFFETSNVTFKILKTYGENTKNNVFKIDLRCYHNSVDKRCTKALHKKRNNCHAKLYLTVKKRPITYTRDVHVKEFPTNVLLHHEHNHPIFSNDALKCRAVQSSVKEKFLKMFHSGLSASKAIASHKLDLMQEFEDEFNLVASDRGLCPDTRWAYYTYYSIFKSKNSQVKQRNLEMEDEEETIENLQKFITKYNEECKQTCASLITLNSGQFAIVLATPLMLRTLTKDPTQSEIIFCESTSKLDDFDYHIFLLLVDSCCGGLPVGVIIASSDDDYVLTCGFKLYKSLFLKEDDLREGPRLIMTDSRIAVRDSFSSAFPNAVVLVCAFNVLQAAWKYLFDPQNEIHFENRIELFTFVKEMVQAPSYEDLEITCDKIKESELSFLYPEFISYVDELYDRRDEWAVFSRLDLIINGTNFVDVCKSAVRCLKDHILLEFVAYTPVQLLQALTSELDEFYARKISFFMFGNQTTFIAKQYPEYMFKNLTAKQLSPFVYYVHNTSSNATYAVDIEMCLCSCTNGTSGKMCLHQFLVSKQSNKHGLTNPLDNELKSYLSYIATGSETMEEDLGCCNDEDWKASDGESTDDFSDEFAENGASNSPEDNGAVIIRVHQAKANRKRDEKAQILRDLKDMFKSLNSSAKMNKDMLNAVKTMVGNFKSMHSENARIAACHTFGKFSEFAVKARPKSSILPAPTTNMVNNNKQKYMYIFQQNATPILPAPSPRTLLPTIIPKPL